MMGSVDLEENNDDCIVVDDKSKDSDDIEKSNSFKRRLIFQVRKHRLLYDNTHKHFSNVAKKDLVWQEIAKKMDTTVDDCKDTWYEIRYSYQRYCRRLRNYCIHGHNENRKRPAMYLETELLFLWRFVGDRKTCKISLEIYEDENVETELEIVEIIEIDTENDTKQSAIEKDDDLILVEQPVELIVIDEDDDNGKSENQFQLSTSMKLLISQIKNYPELYDSEHISYRDYTRKSYIWNAIAGNLGDKATKLMKSWFMVQTRYEWEICQANRKPDNPAATSELQLQLEFLKDYILKNPETVYKQSYFLKSAWYDPIEYFKDIYNLIVRMKKMSDIVVITDSFLFVPEKSKQYISLWKEIASLKGSTAGQCEITWLIMRHFYWELRYMRTNYKLTDKWYFETIISELYAICKTAQTSKEQEFQVLKQTKPIKKANKRPAQTTAISLGAPSTTRPSITPTTTHFTPTIINNLQNVPTTSSTLIVPSVDGPPLGFPKITAAISLAPQSLNTGSLQIKQISGPPNLSPAPGPHNVPPSTFTTATLPTETGVLPPQMSISFNLPTQTIVKPLSIPPLVPFVPPIIRPAGRNTTPAMISAQPQALLRPPPPQIQTATWSATPTTTTNSMVRPQMASDLQTGTFGGDNSMTSSSTNITATQSIASSKVITTLSNNSAESSNNPALANNSTVASSSLLSTVNTNQLPKITGATSLLNPNEILIELIASHSGNQLVVHGPSLSTKYQLPMPVVAKLIRAVLAIPLLHNKRITQPNSLNFYWEHISSKFDLPVHICRACWNFLLENFNHFPQIAPLNELMKPFQTELLVWKESNILFKCFDEHCTGKGWFQYMDSLPEVIDCISSYPVLYKDVADPSYNQALFDMEILCAWRTISLRFPKIPEIQEIWSALKKCFCQYMTDLEFGIENKWPINWWRSFARLKFLVQARYSSNEPYYYIVSNKVLEEIEQCAAAEMRNRYLLGSNSPNSDNEIIVTELEANQEARHSEVEVLASLSASSTGSKKEVELGALMTAIQKHPVIYGKADNITKYEAWKKVSRELHMEVNDCLSAFKHATEMYFSYRKQDPVSRCRLNERYYKKLDEIIRNLPSGNFSIGRSKLNVKTPFELNQGLEAENSSDMVFPERYISDINMSNSPSNLVVKNWIFALGNIAYNFGETSSTRLKGVLQKYLPNVK